MNAAAVSAVRSFNRTVTQRVGALNEEYLARGRPLGASRVLWEIGPDGADVRALRARLGLDSGYLSRLLHGLVQEGMIVLEPSRDDRRVRIARITPAGRTELRLLDRRSDDLAASLLAPLDDGQRERLLGAMAVVERLLTAGLVQVEIEPPTAVAARFCIESYFAELNERFETGFDPSRGISADADELVEPRGLLLVARLQGEPVGCGALKLHGDEPAEIKRMWVARSARGLGLGRRLLADLERHASDRGAPAARLETNRSLTEAIALYRSAGYREVAAFNDEPYAHHWFEKLLSSPSAGLEPPAA
jgi:DNA-binding MarR family transcriptional regulator/N-acetylglutamate synthase-like GNAT family acetyltransferase